MAALVAAAGSAAIAVNALIGVPSYPTDGPLQISDAIDVAYPLAAGQATSWGMPLPQTSRTPAVVRRIELLGVERLDVLGVLVCRGWTVQPDGSYLQCAPVNDNGWPPPGITTYPVDGTELAAEPRGSAGLLIGLRRQSDDLEGRIGAVRIIYTAGDVTYQAVEPWSLRLYSPSAVSPLPSLARVSTPC
jgi:hypothetical protein